MPDTKSLADWISDAEYEWRTRLTSVSLVVEADFTADEICAIQSRYGSFVQRLLNQEFTHREIIKKIPALTLTLLVGHAALAYDHGAYWESFWEGLGLSRDADFESVLRRSIMELLDKFSLARFPDVERDSSRKYVMSLTLHAGIPVHCLGDLLRLINEHINRGGQASGAALMAWLDEPGKSYRVADLDVPVRNFLMHGAQFAIDILDRIIEFVEATADEPALLDMELDSSTTGLPNVLLDELINQVRTTSVRWKKRRASTSGAPQRPSIAYNPDEDEIVLTLPYPDVGPEVPWRVSLDGDVREVYCFRKWGAGSEPAATRVPITSPVREVVLSHSPSNTSTTLAVVTKSDPLLAFTANGRWLARRDGLRDAVWAVYPQDHELADALTGKAIEERDSGGPVGWQGWRSAYVVLDKVGSLQLRRSGQFIGSERQVRKDARPWLEIGEPVRGIVSIDGRPVYGARPKVLLPPSPLDRAPSWRVRVRRVGETDWNVDRNWDAAEVETSIDPFDSAEDPQLGSFEIVITGPLGADTRFVGFVAEGVCAEFDTQIRVPVAGGLTACTAEVQARVLSVTPIGPLAFKITDLEKVAEFASDEVVLPVAVRPPHVEIRTGEVGAPVPWRVTADACTPEDFVKNRFVAVRAPGIDRVAFGFISAAGQLEQVEEHVRRKQGGIFELRTERFADTARTHQSGRVVATLQTFDGPVDVTVLMIRPRQLASGVMLHSGILRFDGLAELDDLAAYVWPATAPWRPVRVLSVIEGSAQLPANLVDAGELRCQLFVDDPWVSVEPLAQPAKDAFRIGQAGWFRDGSSVQTKLSRFVAGAGPVPRGIGAIPEIWPVLSWMHADGQVDSASQLTKVLAEEPRKALEGLGNSTIPLHDKMSMLIRTELVNRSYASPETLNELHADPWFGCMVELADLPSLYQRRQKNRDERAETLGYLSDKGGELLIELLRSGKIDALHEGCFGRNVFRLASMPPDQVEGLMREVELIPGPLLHPDTRFTATYEAFSQRTAWMRSGWSESFATQTSFVLSPVRRASALAYDAISIRSDLLEGLDVSEHPWMLMSLQSLTLAFLARLEAHGRIPGQYLNFGMLMAWASLAKL